MNKLNYISLNEALRQLDCSKFFIYKLINSGKLTKKKIGKKTFLLVDELNSLLEEA